MHFLWKFYYNGILRVFCVYICLCEDVCTTSCNLCSILNFYVLVLHVHLLRIGKGPYWYRLVLSAVYITLLWLSFILVDFSLVMQILWTRAWSRFKELLWYNWLNGYPIYLAKKYGALSLGLGRTLYSWCINKLGWSMKHASPFIQARE